MGSIAICSSCQEMKMTADAVALTTNNMLRQQICSRHWTEGRCGTRGKHNRTGMLMAPSGGCCTAIADSAITAGFGSFSVPAAAAADAVATARKKPPISGDGRGGAVMANSATCRAFCTRDAVKACRRSSHSKTCGC